MTLRMPLAEDLAVCSPTFFGAMDITPRHFVGSLVLDPGDAFRL